MSYDRDSEPLSLKKRIEFERTQSSGRMVFSEKLKADICDAAWRATSRNACARALGLSTSLVFRWCELKSPPSPIPTISTSSTSQTAVPPPRRLPVVENLEAPKPRLEDEGRGFYIDVCLPNGVRLKSVPWSRQSLALLGDLT